jgi:hypothetical protein
MTYVHKKDMRITVRFPAGKRRTMAFGRKKMTKEQIYGHGYKKTRLTKKKVMETPADIK